MGISIHFMWLPYLEEFFGEQLRFETKNGIYLYPFKTATEADAFLSWYVEKYLENVAIV